MQETIFEKTTQNLIDGIIYGFNATVFAYGATGAGKTHTMMGDENNKGIMLLAVEELFKQIEECSKTRDYKLQIRFLEVYNEIIKDLLDVHGEP